MSGNDFAAGDRVEVSMDFIGFKRGMIGYVIKPDAQCKGCVTVQFFNDRSFPHEFPSFLLRKANPKGDEVIINENIEAHNRQIELKRTGREETWQDAQNSKVMGG